MKLSLIAAYFLLLVLSLSASIFAQTGIGHVRTSGISKTFPGPFTLTKEKAEDLTAQVLKAQEKLKTESDFYIYFHRTDDRYFQVETIDEVFEDSNAPHAAIDYVSWNLMQRYPEDPPSSNPRRVIHVRYSLEAGDVTLRIDGREMDWALLSADSIESSINRTTQKKFNYINLAIVIIAIATYFYIARLIVKILRADKFKAVETEYVINTQLVLIIQWPPMMFILWITLWWKEFINWLNDSSSYFLWGDAVAIYNNANQLNNNLLWAVVVGLLVSILANIATARLLKKSKENKETKSEPADSHNSGQRSAPTSA